MAENVYTSAWSFRFRMGYFRNSDISSLVARVKRFILQKRNEPEFLNDASLRFPRPHPITVYRGDVADVPGG
ncbi:hypothetical protein ACC763_41595, partial [Rhizobium ruizarguesonis]